MSLQRLRLSAAKVRILFDMAKLFFSPTAFFGIFAYAGCGNGLIIRVGALLRSVRQPHTGILCLRTDAPEERPYCMLIIKAF